MSLETWGSGQTDQLLPRERHSQRRLVLPSELGPHSGWVEPEGQWPLRTHGWTGKTYVGSQTKEREIGLKQKGKKSLSGSGTQNNRACLWESLGGRISASLLCQNPTDVSLQVGLCWSKHAWSQWKLPLLHLFEQVASTLFTNRPCPVPADPVGGIRRVDLMTGKCLTASQVLQGKRRPAEGPFYRDQPSSSK